MSSVASPQSGYAPIHGLRLYYEIHGTPQPGRAPLVLLHGGGDTIETSFGRVIAGLARTRQVIAFEQQGYGRSSDAPDRPFGFETSADDTAALLDYLHIGQADLCGFSNGGTIALQISLRHPRVVRRLVLISTLFAREGAHPVFWESMQRVRLEQMPRELKDAYLAVAPNPANLATMFNKSAQRMRDFRDIPAAAIRTLTMPAFVINGDRDVVRPEHAVALMRLLPGAELAILPGTDHMAMMTRADWLVPAITHFLDAAPAK